MDKYDKLRGEMDYLHQQGTQAISPLVVLGYMSYLDQIEAAAERVPIAERDSLDQPAEVGDIMQVESEPHQPTESMDFVMFKGEGLHQIQRQLLDVSDAGTLSLDRIDLHQHPDQDQKDEYIMKFTRGKQ